MTISAISAAPTVTSSQQTDTQLQQALKGAGKGKGHHHRMSGASPASTGTASTTTAANPATYTANGLVGSTTETAAGTNNTVAQPSTDYLA